jgi:two-component system NarL family sensor kinase
MLRRLPIESGLPMLVFAATRVVAVLVALVAVLALALPDDAAAAVVLGGLALPWTVAVFLVARPRPEFALNPVVPVVDFALLVLLEAVAPETLGAVRLAALFLVAAHAHLQGERRGLAVAAIGSMALVVTTQIRGDQPVTGDVLVFYEVVFVLSALATGLVVGLLRTAESASRLRARGLSRRSLQAESEVRRRVAESLHDGPVQELIALDMILSAAAQAADEGRGRESSGLIEEARELATRNVRTLRDEIVDLGPYAFQELSFDTAVENCMPVWKRRYGFEVMATIERIELAPEIAGDLFRIVQEAVVNAGRHAQADTVSINLRSVGRLVELRVTDNGHGFMNGDPFGTDAPDHFGLASMRERAELLDGELDIETSERGTRVLVRVPLRRP